MWTDLRLSYPVRHDVAAPVPDAHSGGALSDTPGSPRASRLATPGWLDGRLVLGVLLVLVSVVVGARVLSAADRSTLVYAANKDLAAGSEVTGADVDVVRVRLFDNAEEYLRAGQELPPGYVVGRAVGAGELLPRDALRIAGAEVDFRLVTVPVEVGHLPPDLRKGVQVDVWVTPGASARDDQEPADAAGPPPAGTGARADELVLQGAQLVLQGVTVDAVQELGRGFGSTTSIPVVLQVRPAEVARLVSAMSLGRIDLVRVPRQAESSGRLDPVSEAG